MSFRKKPNISPADEAAENTAAEAAEEVEETVDEQPEAENTAAETVETEEETVDEETENPFEAELAKQKDLYLRLAAEYDNFRKRSQREKEALSAEIRSDCIAEILPVLDNIERALAAERTDVDTLYKGVEMVKSQAEAIFGKLGVTAFGEKGDKFDPQIHNCVSAAASEEVESGCITIVIQKGYMLGDRVVRPAMVQVAE